MPQVVKNRYLYGNGGGIWNDIADAGSDLQKFGWIVRALEEKFENSAWVSLSSATADTIAAGASGDVSLDFTAVPANQGDNYANLTITSNDPLYPTKNVTLLLHLNQGPKFEVQKTSLAMNENENLHFQVVATDKEGDNFSVAMASTHSFISYSVKNGTMDITCSPTFNDAGTYTIIAEATDEFGNKNEASIVLTVKNVNRVPVVINPVGNSSISSVEMPIISLPAIIADPDGEILNYTVTSSNESVAKLFMADDAAIITAKANGTTTITVTGNDAGGLSATHSFNITIYTTGVNENSANGFRLYPNPTRGEFNLFLSQNLKTGSILQVTDLKGSVLYEVKPAAGMNPVKLDISNMANGVYLVKINNDGLLKTLQVIKN
jgi:hypothetical protein